MHEAEIIELDASSGELGVQLPEELLEAVGLAEGDLVEIIVRAGKIIIEPIERATSENGDPDD